MSRSIFPAYFAAMNAEERAAIMHSISEQKKDADRAQLLRLCIAEKSLVEIWCEFPAAKSQKQGQA